MLQNCWKRPAFTHSRCPNTRIRTRTGLPEPADVAFVPFESQLLDSGDCAGFCAAVQPRLAAYAQAGVTWLTIEPASRSFTDFRTDVNLLASHLIHR